MAGEREATDLTPCARCGLLLHHLIDFVRVTEVIKASDIEHLRRKSDDFSETEELKAFLARLGRERSSLFLTATELDRILRWKLRGQYKRQFKLRGKNTDKIIQFITGLALTISHQDKEYELEMRIGILCAIRGVAVPVASAILALVYPNEYGVIDFRGWRQVFSEKRTSFSISDYKRYLQELRRLSHELGWPVQEVDLAIWECDRIRAKKKRRGNPV